MPIFPLEISFSGSYNSLSALLILRNNAQIQQNKYCALLRNMVCSISKLPLMRNAG